jgi:2-polyprenyl-3-methyl-5-hydroxy-6-metoxy-1,4-benzoquinol methylase
MPRVEFIENLNRAHTRSASKQLDILDWLSIWENSQTYFDGDRTFGYGGYKYDGRWVALVAKLSSYYNLQINSPLLDIGCAKGFLVHDYQQCPVVGDATGFDISLYALIHGMRDGMTGRYFCGNATSLPFQNNEFDIVFCKDSLHNILDRGGVLKALSEIERVGKRAWIRVGAYNSPKQKEAIDKWATLATSYFSVDEWHLMFLEAGYGGDYDWFHPTDWIADVK